MKYALHLTAAAIVLLLAIWLSSGTMAPYAATADGAIVLEPCHYLINIDHYQFEAGYQMVTGSDPSGRWEYSLVLRRVLYPILASPLMRVFGFVEGGLMATALLHLLSLIVFAAFVRRRLGDDAAIAAAWLLATWPGITYWSGLPYSYVLIVPGSLFALMLLDRLHEAESARDVVRAAFLLGIIFTGYDFLPFFAPAALLILALRRRIAWAVLAAMVMIVPSLLVAAMLWLQEIAITNSNTAPYTNILGAWIRVTEIDAGLWLYYLAELPLVLASNFLFSTMVFLPLLVVVAVIAGRRMKIPLLTRPEAALLIAVVAVWLFNNAAPPYYGWQMRGTWIARLYQPVFVVWLMIIARVVAATKAMRIAVVVTVLANASIAFGPALMNPLAGHVYQRFYVHSAPEALLENLRRFGRRPLGFCSDDHSHDRRSPRVKPTPAWMVRHRPEP